MGKFIVSAVVLFVIGVAVGITCCSWEDIYVVTALKNLERIVRPLAQDNILLFAFILAKNLSVVVLVLFAEQVLSFFDRLRAQLAAKVPSLAGLLSIKAAPIARLIPALVLAVNGAVLSGACYLFWKSGASPVSLVAGLVPHGVPEFSALFLACGAGMAGVAFDRKVTMFQRAVLPLLTVAAVLEVWVTPELMQLVE